VSDQRRKVTALHGKGPIAAHAHLDEVISEGATSVLVLSVTDDGEVRWSHFGELRTSHAAYAGALLTRWAMDPQS
jgi:hypothetical protein